MLKFLVVLFSLFAVSVAIKHKFIYVGYDHVLNYNPSNGTLQAFDMRRNLTRNDTCDFFIYPPLVQNAKFTDALTLSLNPDAINLSFLGYEMFMIQDGDAGNYVIRRCSGFMPQQSALPCEVYAAGKSAYFQNPARFFYGGFNRVIRYEPINQTIDVLFFDADVHGGGYPFGARPLFSGSFQQFTGAIDIAYFYVTKGKDTHEFIIAQEQNSGAFKVFKYNSKSASFEGAFGSIVMTGSLAARHRVRTLLENEVIAYDENDGDYEIWKFSVDSNSKLVIETIKRDNIGNEHGCIFHDRQACVSHANCGWCADSLSCHTLSSNRTACDGSPCRNMVDRYSSDKVKFQPYEFPLPNAVAIFGDEPGDLKSPLRNLSQGSAVPISRDSDLQDEKIGDGLVVNPSEGVVFFPPSNVAVPCMDDKFVDPKFVPAPEIANQLSTMNTYDGSPASEIRVSPLGDAQHDPNCERPIHSNSSISNVLAKKLNSTVIPAQPNTFSPAESVKYSETGVWSPSTDGTAMEEDLMNGVRSQHSSLMPKGDGLAVYRPDAIDTAPPPQASNQVVSEFRPREGFSKPLTNSVPIASLIPHQSTYTASEMELGVPFSGKLYFDGVQSGGVDSFTTVDQQSAMNNAQFLSPKIDVPRIENVFAVSGEHRHDRTGIEQAEGQLPGKKDTGVIEGTATKDISLAEAQTDLGKGAAIVVPGIKAQPDVAKLNLDAHL
eukprot:c20512_g7_i1.p1 GENE.c20512_g7_i1~~c20512_g7_i1.p1  ORF type:complete len:733 (-),score=315.79 c20512_g7_i1:106-2256(-)